MAIEFVDYVTELFLDANVRFKIVKGRNSKLGDFRAAYGDRKHQITVNGDLNKYAFLVTTLHEFAHLHTFNEFKNSVAPHGKEWQQAFRKLLLPVINSGHLPKDLEAALVNSLVVTKASSCSDHNLSRVLHRYDKVPEGIELLEQLPLDASFFLNGREFKKGPLRRKRFLCEEIATKKVYLVNALAKVKVN